MIKRLFRNPDVWTTEVIRHYAVAVELYRIKKDSPRTIESIHKLYCSNTSDLKKSLCTYMSEIGVKADHVTAFVFGKQSDKSLAKTYPNFLKLRGSVYHELQSSFKYSQK